VVDVDRLRPLHGERRTIDVLVRADLTEELVRSRGTAIISRSANMICCVDVDYQPTTVTTACVGFDAWTDGAPAIEVVMRSTGPAAAYQPGAFYERELPYLLGVLERMPAVDIVVVDGYVWLGPAQPGLGWHLHAARGGIVIGVAKTRYAGADGIEVVRGDSARPLFVTAIGIEPALAADHVRGMHGDFRIPTLLRTVDALARGRAAR
jgi:deoxyribonuclease V